MLRTDTAADSQPRGNREFRLDVLADTMTAEAPTTIGSDDVEVSTARLAGMMVTTLALCATVVGGYVAVLSN